MKPYPVIVALDVDEVLARAIAKVLSGSVWGFKVNSAYYSKEGFELVRELKTYGKVFCDFKFHDIPNTVRISIENTVTNLDADLVSVHAASGEEALHAAVGAGGDRVVVVTALTSEEDATHVVEYATRAYLAGVRNIVCSAREASAVRQAAPDATIITPGIRALSASPDDQLRRATPREALNAGADLLVIGRPLTGADDPLEALKSFFVR